MGLIVYVYINKWYQGRGSNPHGTSAPQDFKSCVSTNSTTLATDVVSTTKSEKRDLNPRPQPWQGCALPLSYSRL